MNRTAKSPCNKIKKNKEIIISLEKLVNKFDNESTHHNEHTNLW